MNSQQKKEVRIVESFFKTLCTPVETEPHDKPDVIVDMPGDSRTIGIEVTEYFVDVSPKQNYSSGQRLLGFWHKVQKLIDLLKSNDPKLSKIHAYIKLKKEELKQIATNSIIVDLAAEIVLFVRSGSQEATSDIIAIPDWQERSFSDFSGYPRMNEYVAQVIIRKGIICCSWDANVNASHIGINYEQLAKIIEGKNEKAKEYKKRENLNELWLLIAAPHDSVFNAMHAFPNQIDFANPKVQEACRGTTFNSS